MAQTSVNFNHMSFTIPKGWVGQEADGGYVMQSQNSPYYMMVQAVPFESMEQVQQEMNNGIQGDDGSVSIIRTGEFEYVGKSGLGANFSSDDIFQSLHMYVAGIYSSPGRGVMLISGHHEGNYSNDYVLACKQVAKSIRFNRVVSKAPSKKSWNALEERYTDIRLTYIDSYYSSGYGDMGGGYRQKIIIDLCNKGYFTYSDNFEMGGGNGNSTFIGADGNAGNGTWSIEASGRHSGVLKLYFHNGEVYTYQLETNESNETYLDGYRYYKTTPYDEDPNYQPQCF